MPDASQEGDWRPAMGRDIDTPTSEKPRAKYLGDESQHMIEHAEDVIDVVREDELVDMPAHEPEPDQRPEEPYGETKGSTENT
jgi:hypothetical protein